MMDLSSSRSFTFILRGSCFKTCLVRSTFKNILFLKGENANGEEDVYRGLFNLNDEEIVEYCWSTLIEYLGASQLPS